MKITSSKSNLLIDISMLNARISKRIDRSLAIHGISFTEYLIIHRLYEAPNRTMRRIDLADSVSLSASGVTRLLAPMQKIGLVEKEINPRDARVSLVKLSLSGATIYEDANTTLEHHAADVLDSLTERQQDEMKMYINRIQ